MKIRFAKMVTTFFILVIFARVAAAQEACDFGAQTAPLLLNLRLGMSAEEARAALGNRLKIKAKRKGERTFFQNFIKEPAPAPLAGVRALYLRFSGGRLYQIEIFYEPRADLPAVETIAERLSAQLVFPFPAWKTKNGRAVANCGAATLVADNVLNPRIELTDETVRARIEAAQ